MKKGLTRIPHDVILRCKYTLVRRTDCIDMNDRPGKEQSKELEYHIPPYFDRYQEEREKRYQSELHRVEEAVDRNSERIDDLKEYMDQRFDELRSDMDRRFGEVDRRFDELRSDMDRRFNEQAFWMKLMFGTLASMMIAILIKLFM